MYKVYIRGLIEISNKCRKNCLYCGIRAGNCKVRRYELSNEQILQASRFALDNGYGSVVLQAGERCDSEYVENIARLVYDITHLKSEVYAPLAVTLSLGEQSRDVYKLWHEAGAARYLLRIEASDKTLYERLHPRSVRIVNNAAKYSSLAGNKRFDNLEDRAGGSLLQGIACGANDSEETVRGEVEHSYVTRMECLENLKSLGYITGSGMMIGLPFQTRDNLEHDIDFMVSHKIDMVGMGPYIPHKDTPLGQLFSNDDLGKISGAQVREWTERRRTANELSACSGKEKERGELWGEFVRYSGEEKVALTIELIKELRRRLPDINIAATTALQVLSPGGREEAIKAGANVVMPNITMPDAKREYNLYQGKVSVDDSPQNVKLELERNLSRLGCSIAWGEAGNPPFRY